MKRYVKEFLFRGCVFGGFGPIVCAIIILIISIFEKDLIITANEYFTSVISLYLLAFVVAGCSILYQIDSLGIAVSTLIHMGLLYVCYLTTYLLNNWINCRIQDILIFSGAFIGGYLIVWTIIYCILKINANKLNKKICVYQK